MHNGTKSVTFSLGALLYPWPLKQIREFYTQVALNPAIKRVYLGEIVCAKRAPVILKLLPELIGQLQNAAKEITIATPILNNDDEAKQLMLELIDLARKNNLAVELNDLAGLKYSSDLVIEFGAYLNIYNQATAAVLERYQPQLICPPFECSYEILVDLAKGKTPLEVNVFGRIPLSISSRCFIARNLAISRDNCKLVCFKHSAGLATQAIEDKLFILNGMQVQSNKIYNLLADLAKLQALGINSFRINPTTEFSLAQIIELAMPNSALAQSLNMSEVFANGYFYAKEGYQYITAG